MGNWARLAVVLSRIQLVSGNYWLVEEEAVVVKVAWKEAVEAKLVVRGIG